MEPAADPAQDDHRPGVGLTAAEAVGDDHRLAAELAAGAVGDDRRSAAAAAGAAVTRDDHRLAAELAAEAGELLVELRGRLAARGASAPVLKAEGDRRAHRFLADRLAAARPGDAVLSEEAPDDRARLEADRVWIIDPLDGTREFSEPPRADWAVHVALVIGQRPVAGAVALPAAGLTLSTLAAPELPASSGGPPRLAASRNRITFPVLAAAEALGAELVLMGSAGAKAMAVVQGQADAYVHSGGQWEWDSCAPVAVAAAAGCFASRLDGSELRYNQPDPYLPDLIICRRELADALLEAVGAGAGVGPPLGASRPAAGGAGGR